MYTKMSLYIMLERLIQRAKGYESDLNSKILQRVDGDYNFTAGHD